MGRHTFGEVTFVANSIDPQNLDHQLGFSLYVCSKELIRLYRPYLEEYNLTYTGYLVLSALWEKDNVNIKELGKRLTLDSGTLTPLLKKLEQAGFLERVRNPDDERYLSIALTRRGRALRAKLEPMQAEVAKRLGLFDSEILILETALHGLMSDLETVKEEEEKKFIK